MDNRISDSGITSTFQFVNYKIDKIDFQLEPMTNNIVCQKQNVDVKFSIAFSNALKFEERENKTFYVSRLQAKVDLFNNKEVLAKGIFSISGIFSTENAFSEEVEQNLIKNQAPAILLPYLRAAITNILASSGFDTVILPLVNIQAAAKTSHIEIENI